MEYKDNVVEEIIRNKEGEDAREKSGRKEGREEEETVTAALGQIRN